MTTSLHAMIESESGRGFPLGRSTRDRIQKLSGEDLSRVRVHTGPTALAVTRSLRAEAVTSGSDIFLGGDGYEPGSETAARLIAHEVAHVLQQQTMLGETAGPRVGRAGDRWEQAADVFAHRIEAGLSVRAPRGRRSPRAGSVVQCHESFEHRALGDLHTVDLTAISAGGGSREQILNLQIQLLGLWQNNPTTVTAQQVQALCPWIRTLTLPGSGLLVTYGELNALPDYIATATVADELRADVLLPILQYIRQEGYNRFSAMLNRPASTSFQDSVFPTNWYPSFVNKILGTQALDDLTASVGIRGTDRYGAVIGRNACHFAPYSWYRWQSSYLMARELAAQAHAASNPSSKAQLTHQAWIWHGYADHFLQDSFAAGHLINKTLIMQWFIEWVAGQAMVPVADWDRIKDMTVSQQPLLSGPNLYAANYAGGSNDPQTAEDQASYQKRLMTCRVQAGSNLTGDQAYQNYLTFLSSVAAQLSAGVLHDYYNAKSLYVASVAQPKPYEIWGDDTLLTGPNGAGGVQATSSAAQMSQQSILDLLAGGSTSITTQEIRDQFPTSAQYQGQLLPLEQWNATQKQFGISQSFEIVAKSYLTRVFASTVQNISRDADLDPRWSTSLPGTGYSTPTTPCYYRGRVFGGSAGHVLELGRDSGTVLQNITLDSGGEVALTALGSTLFAGLQGRVQALDLTAKWTKARWVAALPGASGAVAVCTLNGRLFAASNGYAYEVDPGSGAVSHRIQLASSFGTGDYTSSIAGAGSTIFVGTHGYVYGINLNNMNQYAWSANMTSSGYNWVTVLAAYGRLFAGSNGYVYEVNPSTGALAHKLLVTSQVGVGDYTTRLACDGQVLYVGTHGYVYGVNLADWNAPAWTANLAGNRYQDINLLLSGSWLYAGSYGYLWRIDPHDGSVVEQLLLTSPVLVPGTNYETRLVDDGNAGALFVGVHGYIDGVSLLGPAVWGVNAHIASPQNNIFRKCGTGWDPVPGYLTCIGSGTDGNVWGVNANIPVTQNNVFVYTGAASWDGVAGHLTQIAVGENGTVWGVNANIASPQNNIFRWNGSGWDGIGGYLTCVAIGTDGAIWGVNTTIPMPQNNIFRWNGTGWDAIAGHLTQIAVGEDAAVWGVNASIPMPQNNIFHWNGSSWDAVAGYLTSIAVGLDGSVWGCNASQPDSQNNIYHWNGKGWDPITGYLTQLAAT